LEGTQGGGGKGTAEKRKIETNSGRRIVEVRDGGSNERMDREAFLGAVGAPQGRAGGG